MSTPLTGASPKNKTQKGPLFLQRNEAKMSIRTFNITVNGTAYEVTVEETTSGAVSAPTAAPAAPVDTAPVAPTAPAAKPAAPAAKPATVAPTGAEKISAPFPGTVVSVNVTNGAAVKKGDILCVIEAMKMENEITAPKDATIASVNVTKGASVQTGDLLVSLN